MIVRFLLVCEGSSDGALVHHIRALLIKHGATEADGSPYHSGTPLSEKVKQGLELSGSPDLLFIHRDADNHHNTAAAGPKKRYEEIVRAVQSTSHSDRYVRIIPVHMTEAWLLVNPSEIRRVAGNPRGEHDIGLPIVRDIETIVNPKEWLEKVLFKAGLPKGKRRQKAFREKFGEHRRQLIENLPVGGPLECLDSWVQFRDDTIAALLRALRG